MSRRPSIAELKHKFTVCSQSDVVLVSGDLALSRTGLYEGWGSLEFSRGSFFAKNGAAVEESRNSPSATIRMRYRPDVLISSGAWIYEKRLKSAPRWFKILSVVEDDCNFFVFKVRLVERGDDVLEPKTEADQAPNAFAPVAPSTDNGFEL